MQLVEGADTMVEFAGAAALCYWLTIFVEFKQHGLLVIGVDSELQWNRIAYITLWITVQNMSPLRIDQPHLKFEVTLLVKGLLWLFDELQFVAVL